MPAPNTIRNRLGSVGAGKVGVERTRALCEAAGQAAGASEFDPKKVVLKFDEINIIGDVAFRVIRGEFHFYVA